MIPLPPMEMPATALAPGGIIGAIARRHPVGAVARITPYNFPIVNMAGKLGPALAMGNTVVVRPASQNPLAVIELVRIMHEVGFPPGVVNVVTGSTPATGEALVETRDIDMVSFTGSTGVGMRIGEVGGRTMKRLLLELGGKGAALVFDDADLKTAIGMIGSTWTFHSGQICTAPTRAIVQRGVYDQVVAGLAQMAKVLKVGDPVRARHGPRTGDHRGAPRPGRELRRGRARAKAREVVAGGQRPEKPDKGYYVAPTLLAGCRADMKVVQEEIFGPVIVVLPFDDDDEGIALDERHRLRAVRLRVQCRHEQGVPREQAAAGRQHRDQHDPAQPQHAVRRHQVQRRRPRRRRLRPPRVQRAPVGRLARLMEPG